METRFQLAPLLRRFRRVRIGASWSGALLLAVAIAVEIVGRHTTSDLQDCFALVLLGGSIAVVYVVRGRERVLRSPVLLGARSRLRAWLHAHRLEVGVDLRGAPPIQRGVPPLIDEVLSITAVVAAVFVIALLAIEVDDRAVLVRVFYLGYLLALGALWVLLSIVILAALFLPAACINDAFAVRHRGSAPRRRRPEAPVLIGYFGAVLLAGSLLPQWVASVIAGSALLLFYLVLRRPTGPAVTLLWRLRNGFEVHSLDWRAYELRFGTILVLGLVVLVLASTGKQALGLPLGDDAESMPITMTLGTLAAWLGAAGLLFGALFAGNWFLQHRRRDPARPCAPRAHVGGDSPHREAVAAVLQRRGWEVVFAPESARACDVQLRAVPSPMPPLADPVQWPAAVSAKAVEVPELQDKLQRRAEIQRRRQLMRGLQLLFKHASRRSFRRGSGFWIAPHYWYIAGMTRDVDEDDLDSQGGTIVSGIIGPAYHVLFSRAARNHFHVVLAALDVDLLFVEDGVDFKRLRAVLAAMFEHFDIHGDRQRLEDRHLVGLPGTRVIVHDFEFGEPLRRKGYPEPDYDTLGRARILHVFRDRGEHEDPVLDPVDIRDMPVPMAN